MILIQLNQYEIIISLNSLIIIYLKRKVLTLLHLKIQKIQILANFIPAITFSSPEISFSFASIALPVGHPHANVSVIADYDLRYRGEKVCD